MKVINLGLIFLISSTFCFSPFFFSQVINEDLRIILFLTGLAPVLLSYKIPKTEINLLLLLLFIFFIYLSYYLFSNFNSSAFIKIAYFFCNFIILILFTSNNSKSSLYLIIFKRVYISFFYIFCLFNIVNFILILLFDFNFKIFNFNFGTKVTYLESIFGVGYFKSFNFIDFQILKTFSFFYEPIYASFFFFLNSFYLVNNEKGYGFFKIINFLSGILTFSFTFYFLTLIKLFIISPKNIIKKIFPVIFILLIFFQIEDITSFGDRIERYKLFLEIYDQFSIINYLFGYGWEYFFLGKAPSSGILFLLYETGILGLSVTLYLVYKRINLELFIIFCVILLLIPIYNSPLFTILIAYCSNKYLLLQR